MKMNEIPIGYNITITVVRGMDVVATCYSAVLANKTRTKSTSIVIPPVNGFNFENSMYTMTVSYYDRKTQKDNVWRDVHVKQFNNSLILTSDKEGVEVPLHTSLYIPLNLPCSITGGKAHCAGCTLNDLSLSGFSISIADTPLSVKDELTISFDDGEDHYVFNGTIVHTDLVWEDIIHARGVITDSMQDIRTYITKKTEEVFNNEYLRL